MVTPISKDSAEHYHWGQQCDGWHLLKNDAISIIQERVPPGASEVQHFHQSANQFFYVLTGTAIIVLEATEYMLKEGEGIQVPAGTVHQLRNESNEDVHFLVISNPPSHGDRVLV